MGEPTNVTVPSIMQLENLKGFSYRLNDFALFSGALPQQTKSLKGPNPVAFGMVWTTSLAGHHQLYAMSVDKRFTYLPVRFPVFPHAKHVAVAPRFVNPERNGISTTYYQNKQCLTLNGQIVYYPQSMVSPFGLPRLTQALVSGQLVPLNNVPFQEYANYEMDMAYSAMSNPYTNDGVFYRFEGRNYAMYCYPNPQTKQNQYYWFNCEPIVVERQPDNSLQCMQPLFAASYEPVITHTTLVQYLGKEDRESFLERAKAGVVPDCRYYRVDPNYMPLGQYLNTGFMNQLAMSTNFTKLDELQQVNVPMGLASDFMM